VSTVFKTLCLIVVVGRLIMVLGTIDDEDDDDDVGFLK
jgi:hypothetical protein